MEVRFQEHQVDRQAALRGTSADQHLAARVSAGIWLLRQRESGGRSSQLEPGSRGASAVALQEHAHAAIQRLCRSGATPLRRNGSAEELLTGNWRSEDR